MPRYPTARSVKPGPGRVCREHDGGVSVRAWKQEIVEHGRALVALRERCDEALSTLAGEDDPRVPNLDAHSEAMSELIAELATLLPSGSAEESDDAGGVPIPPSPWPLRHELDWPLIVMDLIASYDVVIAGHRSAVVRSESWSGPTSERFARLLLRQVRRLESFRDYMEAAISDYEEATMTRHTGEIPTIASGTLAP